MASEVRIADMARSVARRPLPPVPPAAEGKSTLVLFYQYIEPPWDARAHKEALKRVLSIEDAASREEAFRNSLESCDVDAQCDSAGILAALDETMRDVTLRGDAHEDLVEALQSLAEIAAECDFGYSEPADDESR